MEERKELSITASARLIHQLGEQLITDELVALMELVKNSYDADATLVKVKIDTNYISELGRGKITIEDNGHGMLPSIIENTFLRISTEFKIKNNFSLKYGRMSLGNKGLGRLSFQRLGNFINIITTPEIDAFNKANLTLNTDLELLKKYPSFHLKIDWNVFNSEKELQDLKADLFYLKKEEKKGTIIEIVGLRNIEFWNFNKTDCKELIKNLYGMTNPFNSENSKDKFKIKFYLNDNLFTNEEIDEDLIKNTSYSDYEFALRKNIFTLKINYKEKFLKRLVQRKIKELENLNFVKDFPNIDFSSYKTKEIKIDLETLFLKKDLDKKDEFYSIFNKINLESNENGLALPGDFKGKLYYNNYKERLDFDKLYKEKILPESIKNYNQYKDLLKRATGFYIFRNGFRILPYGKLDWAGFDLYTKRVKYTPFENSNFSGYIDLDGESSLKLREQTSRLGLIEDEYGKNFMKIIKEIMVYLINASFINLRDDFQSPSIVNKNKDIWLSRNGKIRFKKIKTIEENKIQSNIKINTSVSKLTNIYEKIISEKSNELKSSNNKLKQNNNHEKITSNQNLVSEIKKLAETLKKELEFANELSKLEKIEHKQEKYLKEQEILEIKNILPMAGQGIIVESMTHELDRIQKKIRDFSLRTIKLIKELEFNEKKDVILYQDTIIDETIYLKDQLTHLKPTYKKQNRLIENIEMKQFLSDTYLKNGTMKRKANDNNVEIDILGQDLVVKANKGYLITIFDNLFLNSIYWLEFSSLNKRITFEIKNNGEILYYDSGMGIHKDIEHKLFEPFESRKKDGRGLGLFIVTNLLENLNASISLTDELKMGRKFKFLIKFEEIENQRSLF